MPALLTPAQLEELREFNTPTICNAIETFGVRPHTAGYTSPEIRCLLPGPGRVVGYAATACVRAGQPRPPRERPTELEFWAHVLTVPAPRITVVQDLDDPPLQGAYIGDVHASVHQALGAVAHVTNGSVRDLDEVRDMNFAFFGAGVAVSHAYVHVVSWGEPVQVGGLAIRPGDLLHGDEHGICLIPAEVADQVAEAARGVLAYEAKVVELCRSEEFSLARLEALMKSKQ